MEENQTAHRESNKASDKGRVTITSINLHERCQVSAYENISTALTELQEDSVPILNAKFNQDIMYHAKPGQRLYTAESAKLPSMNCEQLNEENLNLLWYQQQVFPV